MFAHRHRLCLALALVFGLEGYAASVSRADEVLYWNSVAIRSIFTPPAIGGALHPRYLAIVHVSMFEAVNGIERRYTPIRVTAAAPRGASRRAAAAQAAYTSLALLFPAHIEALDADLAASLAAITDAEGLAHSRSIQLGREWGHAVATEIVAWRELDGALTVMAPWLGGPEIGRWRPTPRPSLLTDGPEQDGVPGVFLALATSTPFIVPTPDYFRPAGPPALTSAQYAADYNEVKEIGAFASATRTADQTQAAKFWGGTAASAWNRIAAATARDRNTTLSQNARLFALLNMAAHDSAVGSWESKRHFEFWRPITAIRLGSLDGNPQTAEQAGWVPLLTTPPYPDYLSGNQSLGAAYYAVMVAFFGNNTPAATFSEASGTTVIRSWANFEAVADDALGARIWAGIHFRSAMEDTRAYAIKVAEYVLDNAARPIHGARVGQLRK